jgi:hypothetical protein
MTVNYKVLMWVAFQWRFFHTNFHHARTTTASHRLMATSLFITQLTASGLKAGVVQWGYCVRCDQPYRPEDTVSIVTSRTGQRILCPLWPAVPARGYCVRCDQPYRPEDTVSFVTSRTGQRILCPLWPAVPVRGYCVRCDQPYRSEDTVSVVTSRTGQRILCPLWPAVPARGYCVRCDQPYRPEDTLSVVTGSTGKAPDFLLEETGSNMIRDFGHHYWGTSWFTSVAPGEHYLPRLLTAQSRPFHSVSVVWNKVFMKCRLKKATYGGITWVSKIMTIWFC